MRELACFNGDAILFMFLYYIGLPVFLLVCISGYVGYFIGKRK